MGSESDADVMAKARAVLEEFGVDVETKVISAHRKPDALSKYVRDADERGCAVYICGAGMAAALPGVVAAQTPHPVIGVPIASSSAVGGGLDSLLSIVQMPPRVPVATVAINGAQNAGLLAVQILATADETLAKSYAEFKRKLADG
jgi:5-(carboxyamino)imidazole ribonucleotide mutase